MESQENANLNPIKPTDLQNKTQSPVLNKSWKTTMPQNHIKGAQSR